MPENLSSYINKAGHEGLLNMKYREPGITAYNRLEPRPRTEDFERSIRAEIRDPLWMLTRQWQMGELEAEDAGSAIDARLLAKSIAVDRLSLKPGSGQKLDENIPLETFVERETIPWNYALKVQMGQYFLKLHSVALRNKYINDYHTHYSVTQGREDDYKGQIDGLNLYNATSKKALDGSKIYTHIVAGTFTTTITIDSGDTDAMRDVMNFYKSWFERQYSQPSAPTDSAWHPQQLDYQFAIGAPDTQSQVVLSASQYYSGRLDWYSFDNELSPQPLPTTNSSPPVIEEPKPISFIPSRTAFKGMPNPRFWEMEDRQIDFGKLNAKTTDQLMLVLAEFGLIYNNDWFVFPYKLPVNTITTIQGLVVTDVFGDRIVIPAAGEGTEQDWQRWSMFSISNLHLMGQYNRMFFLPASLTHTLEGEPLEQVNWIRDEMANMVWAIEDIIPDATGKSINAHEVASQAGVLPPEILDSPAKIRYLLGTTVPENWIPFIPVQKPGSVKETYFQRASMPNLETSEVDIVKGKGVLLNEVASPYFINEEEIPYAGTIVKRIFQRTRWYDGKTYVWIGRYRETGRGEGSSKLRFDQVEPVKGES